MKAVVGFFDSGKIRSAHDALLASGFRPENVRELAMIDEVPAYLEGEPEKTASWGWLIGTILGGLIGAAGGWLLIGAFNLQMSAPITFVFILVSAIAFATLGGYLASIYLVRADTKLDMDIREALSVGKELLMVRADEREADIATRIMKRHRSEKVETHLIPPSAILNS